MSFRGVLIILLALAGVSLAQAQPISAPGETRAETARPETDVDIFGDPSGEEQPQPVQGGPAGGDILLQERSTLRNDIPAAIPEQEFANLPPYGSQIFTNSSLVDRSVGVNPEYRIAQGDRIAVRMWGARTFDGVLIVDIQGNIFLPEVGPVPVEGITNSQLAQRVRGSVANVFTDNVRVYTNLLGTQPLGVFVSGAVIFPGRYPGTKGDSVLYFLARAGGVDPSSGSYRDIRVIRNGKLIASVDLYEFLSNGVMPDVQFSDNDSIVIGPQLPVVSISGDVKNRYQFEIGRRGVSDVSTAADLIALAHPLPSANQALIRGIRDGKEFNTYIPISELAAYRLLDGDDVFIQSDREAETIVVKVDGNDMGPSAFAVPRATRLGSVVQLIEIDPEIADIESIYLRRTSVATRQQQAIDRSLYELQRSVLTDNSISGTESQIRVAEAALVERFVQQARSVRAEGRVVLAGSDWQNILLEDGDEVVIPKKSDVVLISGEVQLPQTVLWQKGLSVHNYIDAAGGVSSRGDSGKVLVLRSDGSVHNGNEKIRKGDHIMVLPAGNAKSFAIFKDIVEVIYRVALSAAVVIRAN
ncbi:MAG: polysaccharide biosynthesis/export family protein [Parvibaculum sp.]